MTYGDSDECPILRRDIRPLLPQFARRMLGAMARRQSTGLEVCLVCGQDFVSMTRCTTAGDGTWWLLLRCGACNTWHETVRRDEAVAALHNAIKRGVQAIAEQVRWLEHERVVLIGPDDFPGTGNAPA